MPGSGTHPGGGLADSVTWTGSAPAGHPGGGTITTASPALAGFNSQPARQVERELLACCAAPGWARRVAAGRPYPDLAAVQVAAAAGLAELAWPEVAAAVAAHPRIGDRVTGGDQESTWSRQEQSGMDAAGADTRAALAEANRQYQDRFGHGFLICAAGRTGTDLLAAARSRLRNDEAVERDVVRTELAGIVRLRLERLLG